MIKVLFPDGVCDFVVPKMCWVSICYLNFLPTDFKTQSWNTSVWNMTHKREFQTVMTGAGHRQPLYDIKCLQSMCHNCLIAYCMTVYRRCVMLNEGFLNLIDSHKPNWYHNESREPLTHIPSSTTFKDATRQSYSYLHDRRRTMYV